MQADFINEVTITGTYEAVAEVCMAMSEQLSVSTYRGEFRAPYCRADLHAPIVVAHDFQEFTPGMMTPFVDAAVRQFGNETTGWRRPEVHRFESAGISPAQEDEAAAPPIGVAQLHLAMGSAESPPLHFLRAISARCPDVVVALVSRNDEEAQWSAIAYRAGAVLKAVGDDEVPLPDIVVTSSSEAEAHECSMKRTAAAHELLDALAVKAVRTAPRTGTTPVNGFPRWSLLAHAAYDGGVKGLLRAMGSTGAQSAALGADLVAEVQRARALGVASWADTVMFGRLKLPDGPDGKPRAPHAEMAPLVYLNRHRELLSTLGSLAHAGSPESPLAAALLASLSDPSVRLLSGIQPVAHLAAACGKLGGSNDWVSCDETAARRGLVELIAALAAKCAPEQDATMVDRPLETSDPAARARDGIRSVPRRSPGFVFDPEEDQLLGSVMAVALEAPLRAESLAPALSFGVKPSVLFRSALWNGIYRAGVSDKDHGHGTRYFIDLMDAFTCVYGSPAKFPIDLAAEMEELGPALKPLYDAARNESLMRAAIEAAAATAPAAALRQRRAVGV
jgi:hypothetical protein